MRTEIALYHTDKGKKDAVPVYQRALDGPMHKGINVVELPPDVERLNPGRYRFEVRAVDGTTGVVATQSVTVYLQ